jgi:hypothetical protein
VLELVSYVPMLPFHILLFSPSWRTCSFTDWVLCLILQVDTEMLSTEVVFFGFSSSNQLVYGFSWIDNSFQCWLFDVVVKTVHAYAMWNESRKVYKSCMQNTSYYWIWNRTVTACFIQPWSHCWYHFSMKCTCGCKWHRSQNVGLFSASFHGLM